MKINFPFHRDYRTAIFPMLLLLFGSAYSGTSSAGAFLRFSTSARASALGKAGTAVIADPSAIYWNPANLNKVQSKQLFLLHSQYFISDINYDFGGFVYPMEDKALAFGFSRLGVDNIIDSRYAAVFTDNGDWYLDYSKLSYFSTADYIFYFSYASAWNSRIDYGVNAKLIYRNLGDENAFGIGFDMGINYKFSDNLRFGATLQDITTTPVFYSTDRSEYTLPRGSIAAAYDYKIPSLNLRVTPTAQFDIYFEALPEAPVETEHFSLETPLGLEVSFLERFSVRMGLDGRREPAFGAGISLGGFTVDYAFSSSADNLGNINVISANIDLQRFFGF